MLRRLMNFLATASLAATFYLVMGVSNGWNFQSSSNAGGARVDRPGLIHIGKWDGGIVLSQRSVLGFQVVNFIRVSGSGRERLVDIPYWPFIVVASSFGFGVAFERYRERKAALRVKNGRCPACGYDLRATPGRCPECGTAPAAR